jgi:hypothetical protein
MEGQMESDRRERWQQLCERATTELDPGKLHRPVQEVNRLLDEKANRLKGIGPLDK